MHSLAVPSIVEQHAEEAAFLWLLRSMAVAAPHYDLDDLARLDGRVDGHIDGLRIAGEAGLRACLDALAAEEPAEAFAAAVLALDLGDERAMDRILTAAIQTPDLMAGVASALGWLPPDRVRPWIAAMIEARPAASRRLGIAACAVHREDPGPVLARLVRDPDGGVRARALRAVGELKRRDLLPALRDAFDDADDDARFWAVWSAVLLGDRSASERLRAYAQLATSFAGRAIQLAPRTMHPGDARDWLKRMAQHAETRRLALIGCGVVGDPVYVPVLISQMSVPELARVAGEAFSMITGVDLAYEDLEGEAPDGFEAGPSESPEDDDVEMDADENLPWPDKALVERWWSANAARFGAGRRYLCGAPIDEAGCLRVLREGRQRQRIAAAYELALMRPGEPLFEWRAPGFRQQHRLGLRRR